MITEASKIACGAVLAQKYDDMERPIAFASKAFTKVESNKSTNRTRANCDTLSNSTFQTIHI